mgnify:CR=1 FL=1
MGPTTGARAPSPDDLVGYLVLTLPDPEGRHEVAPELEALA